MTIIPKTIQKKKKECGINHSIFDTKLLYSYNIEDSVVLEE